MSLVCVSCGAAEAAARATIKWIQGERGQRLANEVAAIIATREWWRRFLPFLPSLSREKVEAPGYWEPRKGDEASVEPHTAWFSSRRGPKPRGLPEVFE